MCSRQFHQRVTKSEGNLADYMCMQDEVREVHENDKDGKQYTIACWKRLLGYVGQQAGDFDALIA